MRIQAGVLPGEKECNLEEEVVMKKTIKAAAALLLSGLLAFSFAGCQQQETGAGDSTQSSVAESGAASEETSQDASEAADTEESSIDRIKAAGKIIMSTNAEFEPFEYMDGTDIVGIDVDISKKIAEKLGVELQINNTSFDALTAELASGKCDFVAAGMSKDPTREESVDFSDPYFSATQSIIVLKDSDIKSSEDLAGKTIGVQLGTTGDQYCTENVEGADVQRMNKAVDAVSDLIAGRLDAVVVDNFPAKKLVANNSDKIMMLDEALTGEEYCIAVPKGDTELLDLINETLQEMEESGELDEIVGNYMSEE